MGHYPRGTKFKTRYYTLSDILHCPKCCDTTVMDTPDGRGTSCDVCNGGTADRERRAKWPMDLRTYNIHKNNSWQYADWDAAVLTPEAAEGQARDGASRT